MGRSKRCRLNFKQPTAVMGKALCQGVFFLNFGVVVVVVVVAVVVDVAASAAAAVGDIGPISDADRRPSKDIRSSGGQGRLRFISKFLSLSLSSIVCLSFLLQIGESTSVRRCPINMPKDVSNLIAGRLGEWSKRMTSLRTNRNE